MCIIHTDIRYFADNGFSRQTVYTLMKYRMLIYRSFREDKLDILNHIYNQRIDLQKISIIRYIFWNTA